MEKIENLAREYIWECKELDLAIHLQTGCYRNLSF